MQYAVELETAQAVLGAEEVLVVLAEIKPPQNVAIPFHGKTFEHLTNEVCLVPLCQGLLSIRRRVDETLKFSLACGLRLLRFSEVLGGEVSGK